MFSLNIPLVMGQFVRRPNRFVMYISIDNEEFGASLPNPGKMQELLFPGVNVLLTPMDTDRVKYPYRVVGVENSRGEWLMLDTVKNNDLAAWLVENEQIPSLKGYKLIRREVTVGDSRFDMLLERDGKQVYCEVKSCTLFGGDLCMFPDAVTERGRRHVQELGDMAREGVDTVVLFMVHSAKVNAFVPDFHTDPAFSETLYNNREDLKIVPVSIGWDQTMTLLPRVKELPIQWNLLEKHGLDDSGLYLFMMKNDEEQAIEIGSRGEMTFPAGYYIYVGSARTTLSKRLARHSRKRKGKHWHIDYLRDITSVAGSWPIRNADLQECDLAQRVAQFAENEIAGFGCSDCDCHSHLFYFEKDPTRTRPLQELLLAVRMEEIH